MKIKANPVCIDCGVELNDENWYPSKQKRGRRICKKCDLKRKQEWRKANPEKSRAQSERDRRKQGQRPMSENKECSSYLGVYIAEGVLSHAFKNVQKMPYGHPGFDFICGQGYKIDVKSSCLRKNGIWMFITKHNTIADYFLCLAFDNRQDLNPLHVWLIPGDVLNHLTCTSIQPSTIHKWDEYRLDVMKVTMCCNAMKEKSEI